MGCSSRTSKRITRLSLLKQLTACGDNKEEHEREVARQVADEFIDSLEELRAHEGLEDFVLAGHSLGGFLAAKYAIKYPKHVSALALISPVGVPEMPPQEHRIKDEELHWRIRFFKNLWSWNFTPQAIVRVAGSRGPDLINNAIVRRFSPNRWNNTELKLISDYLYHITAAPGNGEYALSALLQPIFSRPADASKDTTKPAVSSSVFAKVPVEKELTRIQCPIILFYGDHDWLYYPTASESVTLWNQHGIPAELRIIPKAGHHLYLDNSTEFNDALISWSLRLLQQ
jgi:abhydrolase domain-containing protein 5